MELLEAGIEVTVLESAAFPGGKAASWRDRDGDIIDFGQHVVTPLYKNLLALLGKVGAENNLIWKEGEYVLALRGGGMSSIRIANLPPPFHFLSGLLRYKNIGLLHRLSALPAFTEILLSSERHRRKFDHLTFLEWMRRRGTSRALMAHMIEPMIEGLMFLNSHEVSTTNVMFDLHYMLLNREASRFGFFDGGLQERLIRPIASHITLHGGEILTDAEVTRIDLEGEAVADVEMADGSRLAADTYVSAMPVHRLRAVLPEPAWTHAYFADLRHLEPVPVIGVQLWFDRKVVNVSNLILSPDCIFNAFADATNILSEYRRRPGSIIHFVLAPAGHLLDLPDERITTLVFEDFCEVFPAAKTAEIIKATVVKTTQGFYAQRPGMERYRPDPKTPWPNFFLAGDYTRNRYPPCMEGAVTSGVLAARAVTGAQKNFNVSLPGRTQKSIEKKVLPCLALPNCLVEGSTTAKLLPVTAVTKVGSGKGVVGEKGWRFAA